jgi:hypothetical protein
VSEWGRPGAAMNFDTKKARELRRFLPVLCTFVQPVPLRAMAADQEEVEMEMRDFAQRRAKPVRQALSVCCESVDWPSQPPGRAEELCVHRWVRAS